MKYEIQDNRNLVFGQPDMQGPMNFSQYRMFQAVHNAISKGLFYNVDVYASVCNDLSDILTSEVIEANYKNTKVEHGKLGMDIYYMRKDVVEVWLKRIANKQVLSFYNLQVGTKIKNIHHSLHKFSTSIVTAVDKVDGVITFMCTKRGSSRRWEMTIPANHPNLIQALEENEFPSNVKRLSESDGISTYSIDLGSNDSLFFTPQREALA